MNRLKLQLKKYWPIVLGVSIILSIVFYYVLFNQGVQVFHYDMMEQVIRFILRGYDLIRTPEIEWWDWNHFFGSSVFSYGFYFLFTPFWLFFAALKDKADIPYIFMFVNMLKLIILFINTSIYLSRIRKSRLAVFAGASILTFSGFTMGYYNYTFFTDTLLFVPLVLYFIEVYLEENKLMGISIIVAIMAMINVYLLVLFTPFMFLYTLFRYIVVKPKLDLKNMSVDAGKFILSYLLGIGLGSVLFLPNLSLMLSSSRISSLGNVFETISKLDVYRYVTSFLQPIVDRNNFNPLISKYVVPSYGHSGGAAVYSFIITPLLLPQILSIKNDLKHKIALIVFYGFLIVFSLFPNIYFLLQGNSDTRWMVMFIFLNVYTISYIIDHFKDINKTNLLISFILVFILIVGTYYYSRQYGLQFEEIYYTIAKRNIVILLGVLFTYTCTLYYFKRNDLIKYIIIILITVESYVSLYNIFFNPISSISMSAEEIPSYQLTNNELFKEIKSRDDSFYRFDVLENYGFNNPMSKDYMGFTFYSSVYNFQVDDFIQNNIASAGGWVVTANSGKWQFKEMFASKYWFDLTGGVNIPFGYAYYDTLMYGTQAVDIYENKYPIPLMYAMENSLNFTTWKNLNSLDKMRAIMSQVVRYDDQNNHPIYPNVLTQLGEFSTILEKNFDTIQSNAIVSVTLPRSEEVKISFLLDGVSVRDFYSYEPQYSSVYVKENFNEMKIEVTNLYGVPEEEFINTASIEYPEAYFEGWYTWISKSFVENIKLSNNSFSGVFSSDKEQWIVTSIAYDKNWKVFINDKQVEIEKVNGGFIGFKVQSGVMQIEGTYFPEEIKIGLIISIISLIIIILTRNKHWI